jgi:rhamnose utilization protein RhaD (predicted bifunctional aldolase and dehydrogenase)/NAD(P)-dependent dehydrogenase (short-subunit alcohol dehydrogenase family)
MYPAASDEVSILNRPEALRCSARQHSRPTNDARKAMKNLWDPAEAAKCRSDLELRVYTSRLLGRDDTLVLHGGGNTSVKVREKNIVGEEEEILYVKGSGWDLETIEVTGFAPVRMAHLLNLAKLETLSDPQMVNELAANVTRAGAPAPSVETILHAVIPHKFVDHTHADALLAITNTDEGEARAREIYGEEVLIVPYVMPGFELARVCAHAIRGDLKPGTIGMVLLKHGLFSFGATAEESYARMISLVERAENYLKERGAWEPPAPDPIGPIDRIGPILAMLRQEIARSAGSPVIMSTASDPKSLGFARQSAIGEISQRGPATPDHILRTKRLPMVGRDVNRYAAAYHEYFARNAPSAKEAKTMLDPAPRVVLDPEFGLATVGYSAKEAAIARDLYSHTIDVISRAEALGGYRALSEEQLFEFEYWDLEQAKLRRAGKPPVFAGEIACVTGAASGIGKACVEALLKRGAAVVGLDVDEQVATIVSQRADYLGLRCDLTSEEAITAALEQSVRQFGGLDILILNAGIFPAGRRIESLDAAEWRRVFGVNLDGNLTMLRECRPLLKLAPRGGRVVVIGSKNVAAPGPGAAAYSASKAALTQLARVAALEWGADGIRVNTLHPNAVFDTGIWSDDVLKARAASYGISVEEYKRNNVLKTEVRSVDVGELAAELCGPLFAKTTGAQIPIDGGNERVI